MAASKNFSISSTKKQVLWFFGGLPKRDLEQVFVNELGIPGYLHFIFENSFLDIYNAICNITKLDVDVTGGRLFTAPSAIRNYPSWV